MKESQDYLGNLGYACEITASGWRQSNRIHYNEREPVRYWTCETFQLLNGKGINAEFPSNKPNRIKKLFPCRSSRKHRVNHRYTCDFVFIITLYWSFSDLPVSSSRISRVLARCKVIMRLFFLTEQVDMLNLKSERKKKQI